jgi:Transposase IS66 family
LPQAPVSSPEENSIGTSEEYSLGAHKAYRRDPTPHRQAALRAPFDRIFKRRTGFVALGRLLTLLHANKAELLRVLERPEIPLHTNGSENDMRCQVTRRRISGGPAPMPDAIAATPSSLSPRPAQSLASPFGTTSAQGSPSPAILPSHTSRISSASHIRQPDLPGLLPS